MILNNLALSSGIWGAWICLGASALASTPNHSPRKINPDFYRQFSETCRHAFDVSSSSTESSDFGKAVCQCTAQESKHQKVTLKALKAETENIRKDPKYKIQDPALLAALHVCTMDQMHALEDSH